MTAEAFGLAADLRDSIEVANLRKAARAARQSARHLASMQKHALAAESLEAAARYEALADEIKARHAQRRMTMSNARGIDVVKHGPMPRRESPRGAAKLRYELARDEMHDCARAHAEHPSDEDKADALTRACLAFAEAEAAWRSVSPTLTAVTLAGGT